MLRDGRTDMTKLTVAFCNFAKAPKNADERARSLCEDTYRVDVSVHYVGAHTEWTSQFIM
jgi:hypothetical protein